MLQTLKSSILIFGTNFEIHSAVWLLFKEVVTFIFNMFSYLWDEKVRIPKVMFKTSVASTFIYFFI